MPAQVLVPTNVGKSQRSDFVSFVIVSIDHRNRQSFDSYLRTRNEQIPSPGDSLKLSRHNSHIGQSHHSSATHKHDSTINDLKTKCLLGQSHKHSSHDHTIMDDDEQTDTDGPSLPSPANRKVKIYILGHRLADARTRYQGNGLTLDARKR